MPKTNRFCYTDNKAFYYCQSCSSGNNGYNSMFCCERCSKIFKLLTDETFKKITVSECKKKLLELNVSLDEQFKDSVKKHIENVLSYSDKQELIEVNDCIEQEVVKIEPVKIKNVSKKRNVKNSEVD